MWASAAFLTACLLVEVAAIPPGFVSRANNYSYRRSKTRTSRDRCCRIPVRVDQHQHQVQEQQQEGRRRRSNRPPIPSFSLTSLSAGVLVDSTGFGAAPPGDDREGRASSRLKQQQQQQQKKQQPPTQVRKRPLVDAKQLSSQEVRLRWPDTDFEVPRNMSTAVITFFQQSTPKMVTLGILGVVATRLSCDDALSLVDAAAVPIVAVGWSFQEWALHKYLLHGVEGWMGYDIHQSHHDKPFYHVCIDPPDLVAGWTVAAACIFRLLLPPSLALTVLAAYMVMGLLYEWTHYIAHTRVIPRSELWKQLKRHHTLHHLKDESCWMAFMSPAIDTLFGTVPTDETAGRRQSDVRVESDDSGRLGDDYYRHW